jgi:hypothetical protein
MVASTVFRWSATCKQQSNGQHQYCFHLRYPLIVAGSSTIRQSKTILARSWAVASRLLLSKTNAAKVWVVYQKNMRKTILLAGCALLLGTTVIAGDFAADPLDFRNPQQDLFDNLSEMLRETKELQSCEKQQEEALQRFLKAGLSLNAAALMAHNQYPCDWPRERAENHSVLILCAVGFRKRGDVHRPSPISNDDEEL